MPMYINKQELYIYIIISVLISINCIQNIEKRILNGFWRGRDGGNTICNHIYRNKSWSKRGGWQLDFGKLTYIIGTLNALCILSSAAIHIKNHAFIHSGMIFFPAFDWWRGWVGANKNWEGWGGVMGSGKRNEENPDWLLLENNDLKWSYICEREDGSSLQRCLNI